MLITSKQKTNIFFEIIEIFKHIFYGRTKTRIAVEYAYVSGTTIDLILIKKN